MYIYVDTQFSKENLQQFCDVVEDYIHTINNAWVTNLNTDDEYLSFKIGLRIGHPTYPTHYVGRANGSKQFVSQDNFFHIISLVKGQDGTKMLIAEF